MCSCPSAMAFSSWLSKRTLGPKIAAARLVANDSFLVERLKERLEKVRSGEAQFNRQAGDRVLGLSPVRTGDAEPNPAVIQGSGRPNDDQMLAVRRSLGSDTTYVWGPPGTGKTTTLARIVEAHYRAGRSVLLVSNTNIAVDTALERVAERLKGEPEFHQGLVIRQGPVVKEELRKRFGPQVILEEIVARLGEALRREKDQLAREAAPLETEERALVAALKDLEQLEHSRRSLAERERTLATTRSNAAARAQEAKQHRARAATLRADLERARSMGAVRRFFSGLNPERLAARDRGCRPRRPGQRGRSSRHSPATLPSTRPRSERSATRSTASPPRPGPIRRCRRSKRDSPPSAPASARSASASPPSTASSRRSNRKCSRAVASSRRRSTAPTSARGPRASSTSW